MTRISHLNKSSFFHFIILLLLIAYYPYVFRDIFQLPLKQTTYIILFGLIVGFQLVLSKQIHRNSPLVVIVISLEIISCAVLFLYHDFDVNYIAAIATYVLTLLLMMLIREKSGFESFIKFYNWWIVIMAIGAVITFFIAFFKVPPVFIYENFDTTQGQSWILSCNKISYSESISNIIRPSGYFDEPGALATWGLYAMIFNKLFIKNKYVEYILMFSLLFTFSLAYYTLLPLYIIVFNIRKIKYLLVITTAIASVAYIAYSTKDTEYNIIYELSFDRFKYDSNSKTLTGDNRSVYIEETKKAFRSDPLMGAGALGTDKYGYIGDNPYTLLASHGVWGTLFIYLPLFCVLWLGIKRKKIEIIGSCLILIISYLQRPFSYAYFIHYLMLFLFFIMVYEKYPKSVLLAKYKTE